ncbi:hypothetical protein JK359_11480 [Streptomyces actinomycinicus]|uniref:Uncharacterized protein n=1 Tax=Streptomyces actinomycinicus TaxID=1695166 RepID=A0A937EGF7_9ACTN|nr:hypothetical protein [Streptomyces actinomycinicus]MBL1082593.1 hypothetical protein [Streptomyces actinomycinicus]
MNAEEQRPRLVGPELVGVLVVLTPVLFGTAAGVFLLAGYLLKTLAPAPAIAGDILTAGWVFAGATALVILAAAVVLLVVALRRPPEPAEDDRAEAGTGRPARPVGRVALRTVDFASFVAGGRRAHLREEWAAVLAGDPGNGVVLSPRRRTGYALGFLLAALRMRLSDLAAPLWTPVDWLLSAETRTHGFIALGVGAQVVYIQYADGVHVLVTEGWGWCAGCGVALRLFAGWLRRVRGIELATRHGGSSDR